MKTSKFVDLFKKECSYYDIKNNEMKTLTSLIKFGKDDTLVDIGAGTGRLSFPLSKYVRVTALEPNRSLANVIRSKDIKVIKKKVEEFHPSKKFDYGLIAWPQFDKSDIALRHIKDKIANKLIVIQDTQNDYSKLTRKLFPEQSKTKEDGFLNVLIKYYKIKNVKEIDTNFEFPDLATAMEISVFECSAFYNKELNQKQKNMLMDFLKRREKNGKVLLRIKVKVLLAS